MNIVQNIHRVMKREAQRRDLFLNKTNDAGYRTEEWHELDCPFII